MEGKDQDSVVFSLEYQIGWDTWKLRMRANLEDESMEVLTAFNGLIDLPGTDFDEMVAANDLVGDFWLTVMMAFQVSLGRKTPIEA